MTNDQHLLNSNGNRMMKRKKILVVTMQPPRMPGMGGEVRTYYFIKTATELGDVTLLSLGGPDGQLPVQPDLAARCAEVIEPVGQPLTQNTVTRPRNRWQSWGQTLGVFFMPWKNGWRNFLEYCVQHCSPSPTVQNKNLKWTKRALSKCLRAEFYILSHWFKLPPLTAFMFFRSYETIKPAIDRMLEQKQFDLVWIENTITYPFAREIIGKLPMPKPPIVCSAQNIETLVYQRVAANAKTNQERRFAENQTKLMRKVEVEAYQVSDLVIQCSKQDAELGREMVPNTEFCVVGNGVNLDYFQPASDSRPHDQPTIVFTAGFGYGPNREGLVYFLKEIFPLIQNELPQVRFLFAGSEANEFWQQLEIDDPSIECVSSPEDIRPYFEQAWVYVVPLLAGGGTRLKILEAMSMQRAIVSTSLGAEGIPCENGKHLLLADTPETFAKSVLTLLADPTQREALQNEASAWVKEHYSWDLLCEQAKQKLQSQFAEILETTAPRA